MRDRAHLLTYITIYLLIIFLSPPYLSPSDSPLFQTGLNTTLCVFHTYLSAPPLIIPLCSLLPFTLLISKMIHPNTSDLPDTPTTLAFKRLYAASVWCIWSTSLGCLLTSTLGLGLNPLASLLAWVPLFFMESRSSKNAYYSPLGFISMRVLFDLPLTFSGYTLREFCNLRLFSPLATTYDSNIVQGSMPFPSDVSTLYNVYNVRAVINMCGEYPGPVSEYRRLGVEQLRLPTVDTTVPKPEDLRRGAEFVKRYGGDRGRVFVHCKGGIGRASAMSLAHYIVNEGCGTEEKVKEKVKWMKGKREVVYEGVGDYWAIKQLVEEEGEGKKGK